MYGFFSYYDMPRHNLPIYSANCLFSDAGGGGSFTEGDGLERISWRNKKYGDKGNLGFYK